jgi:uridine kinase
MDRLPNPNLQRVMIIGIAGASGSGKSLLANKLLAETGSERVVVISEDSYYKNHSELAFEQRQQINYDHPDAFDHSLLYADLDALNKGESIEVPLYDHKQHCRKTETRLIQDPYIVVLEGILLFTDEKLRQIMNIRIFIDLPLDICLIRRLRRDILERGRDLKSVLEQYEKTVRPMYFKYIEPSKRYADLIVPQGGENRIAIDIIKAKMKELLNEFSSR